MSESNLPKPLWLGVIFLLVVLALAYLLSLAEFRQKQNPPPQIYGQVADFSLTNEMGKLTTLADLTNRVWAADIIFTRCAGECPRMTAQMKSLQDKLTATDGAKLVSLTTDPDYDSPEILKKYGERVGADFNRWIFLTGTKMQIGNLAANSLKLSSTPIDLKDQKNADDLFIHTTIFVVVDKHARLRGIFQTGGEDTDWQNSSQPKLLAMIRQLEREK